MKYIVNETHMYNTKKEAIRQARNLAACVYEAKLKLGIPRNIARNESQILVRPVFK